MNPLEEGGEGNQEQDVNAFTKGNGKGGYWPYQGAWNGNPNGTGYQGICWSCGEVGHQQRECPKKIQNINCDNLECDFFFGAVEVEDIGAPPMSDFDRTFRRIRRGAKFGKCAGDCSEECSKYWDGSGNKFLSLSEEEGENEDENESSEDNVTEMDNEDVRGLAESKSEKEEGWEKAQSRKMKRVKRREWKKLDICNVEGEEGGASTIKVDFQVAAVKKPLMSVKRICENGNRVCFGPNNEDNYVVNATTNKKVPLRPNGKDHTCWTPSSRVGKIYR